MTIINSGGNGNGWPQAELGPIQRLRVLATALPGLAIAERTLPVAFDTAWIVASDLERTLPALGGRYVSSLAITERDRDHVRATVTGPAGLRDTFTIVLRPGWCWMEGRWLSAAMAATAIAADSETRFAWAARLHGPAGRFLAPVTRCSLDRTLERLETVILASTVDRH